MKRFIIMAVILTVSAVTAYSQPTSTPTPAPPTSKFKVGDMAPDFTLSDTTGQKVKLSDFRGKSNVVLAFYVFAFTGG